MNVDPSAGMRCWAVTVEIGGRAYTIPPLPAVDWWPLLAEGATAETMIEMLPPGHDLDDRLLDEASISGELRDAFSDALEEVCGRTIAEAQAIAGVALAAWTWVGGKLALSGFRWDVMPIAAALDAIHTLLMTESNEDFRKQYEKLLAGAAPKKHLDRAAALSEFEAAAGPRPTAVPLATGGPSGDSLARTRQPPQPPRRRDRSTAPTPPPG